VKIATGLDQPIARDSAPVREVFTARVVEAVDDPIVARADEAGWSVFQSADFIAAIRGHILRGSDKLTLVAASDSAGKPVAVFPFVKRKRFGIPVIEALDYGITDFFAPTYFREQPLSADDTKALWRTALAAVPGVHAVGFKKMPRRMHGKAHALTGADFPKAMHASATTLFLRDASGKETADHAAFARKVKKASKPLQKFGPLSFLEANNQQEVDAYMDKLVEFRTKRFEQLARHDAMLDPKVVAFYKGLADRCSGDRPGRIFALRCGEEIIAVAYGFAYRGAFTMIAPAITPKKEFQVGSPGLIVMFKTLEWCHAQGYAVFDLSVGSLSYKSRFDADSIELFEHHQALTPLGLPIMMEGWLRRWVRRKALSTPGLRTRLEKLRRARGVRANEQDTDA